MQKFVIRKLITIVLIISMILSTGGFTVLADSIDSIVENTKKNDDKENISHKYYDEYRNDKETSEVSPTESGESNFDDVKLDVEQGKFNDGSSVSTDSELEDESDDKTEENTVSEYAGEPEEDETSTVNIDETAESSNVTESSETTESSDETKGSDTTESSATIESSEIARE